MAAAYSIDLRVRVLKDADAGLSSTELAERYHVSRAWVDTLKQHVFLDECGVTTDLLRRYGRSPRGTRLHDHAPFGHWETQHAFATT